MRITLFALLLAAFVSAAPVSEDDIVAEQDLLQTEDQATDEIQEDIVGIALAGGGWRAMGVGIGVVKAMEEQGVFKKFRTVSSNSGGSWFNAEYQFSSKFYDKVNDPSVTAGDFYKEYLTAFAPDHSKWPHVGWSKAAFAQRVLHGGWGPWIADMFNSFDPKSASKEASSASRHEKSKQEILFATTLPANAHLYDLTTVGPTTKLHGSKFWGGTPLVWAMPANKSLKAHWSFPSGQLVSDFTVAAKEAGKPAAALKLTDKPSVGLVAAASSAFVRPMSGMVRTLSSAIGAAKFMKAMYPGLNKDVDPNNVAPCTWTAEGDFKGCGTVPGQYRLVDGGATDNGGLGNLLARLQTQFGVKTKLKLVSVDNNRPCFYNIMFTGFLKHGYNCLGWNTTQDGKLKYHVHKSTTIAKPSFGVKAGSQVEILFVAPSGKTVGKTPIDDSDPPALVRVTQLMYDGFKDKDFAATLAGFVGA